MAVRRVQLEVDLTPRRIRDIIQKADQLRRDSAYFEPGGSYAGGGGNLSDFSDFGLGDGGFGGMDEPTCWSKDQIVADLTDDGSGNFYPPDGMTLRDAYFDGVNANGRYTINEDGSITPNGNLVEGTEVTGLVY